MAAYLTTSIISGTPITLKGALIATFIGAVSGAVTCGIGTWTKSITVFAEKAIVQAVAHGIFQGIVSGVQGGGFWAGAAAGAVSSIASSLYQGVGYDNAGWHGLGGCGATNNTGMIIFGTVMGGAGAAIAGGNFWRGATVGLVVSGLNHAMKHDNKKFIDRKIESLDLDPNAEANIGQSEMRVFAQKMFPKMFKQTGNIGLNLVDRLDNEDGTSSYGRTLPTANGKNIIRIEISRIALTSYRLLASTIGHEINHAFHFISGAYNNWTKRYGSDIANARTEYCAQRWELRAGGLPTMSILKDNYNIMMSYEFSVIIKR